MNEPAFSGYMVEVLLHGMPLLDSSGDGFGLPKRVPTNLFRYEEEFCIVSDEIKCLDNVVHCILVSYWCILSGEYVFDGLICIHVTFECTRSCIILDGVALFRTSCFIVSSADTTQVDEEVEGFFFEVSLIGYGNNTLSAIATLLFYTIVFLKFN
ncbi:hypothetical protein L484_027638 [Morus notabilis]|uniref:Uncharacterized protein n=1 Tax=Morus notabilis TaxID=981085 RepID=W9RCK5_9ROSA|nr:hypothetical protein L484_027638 [Morus notabilis]